MKEQILSRPDIYGLALSDEEMGIAGCEVHGAGSDGSGFGLIGDDENFTEDQILSRVIRRRGRKKVAKAADKRKGTVHVNTQVKRGRPRGSRNKPKQEANMPPRTQEDAGVVNSMAWAQQAWNLSKQFGVVYDGDDGEIVSKLAVQVRKNHPNFL